MTQTGSIDLDCAIDKISANASQTLLLSKGRPYVWQHDGICAQVTLLNLWNVKHSLMWNTIVFFLSADGVLMIFDQAKNGNICAWNDENLPSALEFCLRDVMALTEGQECVVAVTSD
jgi:hypothetical protein